MKLEYKASAVNDTSAWLGRVRYSETVVCGSGHRPNKLRGGYKYEPEPLIEQAMLGLCRLNAQWVLSGMAVGWDQIVAEAALRLRIPFVAVVPMLGRHGRWPAAAQQRYIKLLERAFDRVVLAPQPLDDAESSTALRARNAFMVKHSAAVLALHDGSEGGTDHCLRLARNRILIDNVWEARFGP